MDNLLDYFTGQVDVPDPQSNGDPRAQVLRDIVAKKQRRYAPQQDVYADQRIPGLGLGEANPIDVANMPQSTRKSIVAAAGPDFIPSIGKVVGTFKDVGTAAVGKLSGDERPFVEQMGESQANAGPYRRAFQEASDIANESAGAPKDEDKSLSDQLGATAASLLVPVPALPKGSNLITKGLSHAGNVFVPGSSSLLGAAANVGLGGAITAGVDKLLKPDQEDNFAKLPKGDMPETTEEEHDPNTKSSILSQSWEAPALLAGIIFGAAATKNASVQAAAKAAAKSTEAFSVGGKAYVPPGSKGVNAVTQHLDEFGGVQKMIQGAWEGAKDAGGNPINAYQKGAAAINEFTIDHRSNITTKIEDAITSGHIEGLDKPTIPLNVIKAQFDKLSQMGKLVDFQDHARALDAMDTRKGALTTREKRLDAIRVEQVAAVQKQNHAKYNQLDNERIKLTDEVAKLNADDPSMRGSMTGWGTLPTDERNIKEIIYKGNQDPDFAETHKMIRTLMDDILEAEVRNGVRTRESADSAKALRPNYIPLFDDPHLGAEGAARIWSKAKTRYGRVENPLGENVEAGKHLRPTAGRSLETDSPVNTPMSVYDSLHLRMDRSIRYISHENFKRNVVDNLDAAAAAKGAAESDGYTRYGGPTAPKIRSVEQVKMLDKGLDLKNYTSIMRNGGVELVKFHDPSVRAALEFAPQASYPILRSMKQAFTMDTTGVLRPVFATTNFIYDDYGFQLNRAANTRFGADFLTEQTLMRMGGGKLPDNLSSFIRGIELVSGDPVSQILSAGAAITSFGRQNQMMFARNIAEGLQRQQGFFHVLGQMTGGTDKLRRLGETAAQSFNESYFGMLSHQGVTSAEALQNTFSHMREFDSFFTKKLGPVTNLATSPLRGLVQQYRMMLSSVHSASRVSYAMQQLFTEAVRRGVEVHALPDDVVKRIATDARTMVGDFSRKPGTASLQKVDSASPYFNVMLRTSQAINQRMIRGDKFATTMGVFGVVAPAVMSAYIFTNGAKALYDWYWRDTPDFEREQFTHFLKPQAIYDWITGRRTVKDFTPDDFNKQLRIPEFRPLTSAVVHGLRASGLMSRSNKDTASPDPVNPSGMGDLLGAISESMMQAFTPIAPPGLQALAKWGGTAIDPGNLYKGMSPMQANIGQSNARGGGFNVPMSISSDISKTAGDVIGALTGVMGSTLLQAYDTGSYEYKHADKNAPVIDKVMQAIYGAGKEVAQRSSEIRTDTFVPLMPKAAEKIYKQTPSTKYGFMMRGAVDVRGKTEIPELDYIHKDLLSFKSKNSDYKATSTMYKELKKELDIVDANKSVPYSDRLDQRNQIMKKMNANTQTQNALLYRKAADIAKGPLGEAFQQRFGKPFSMKDFTYEFNNAAHRKGAP